MYVVRTPEKNKLILRRYVRKLGQFKGMKEANKARTFFIVLHNFLSLEDKCYDQCLMNDTSLNTHVKLLDDPVLYNTVINFYTKFYDPNSRVRFAVEFMDTIEEIRLFLKDKDFMYTRLVLDKEFEALWHTTLNKDKQYDE